MLRLILETGPGPQARGEFSLGEGRMIIGRGDDCDWKLDDPQMFVSRRHCVVQGQGGQYRVTDESSGGVFIDGAPAPLGQGVTAVLVPGMRLKIGDFVIRAEISTSAPPPQPQAAAAPTPGMFGGDFFTPRPEAPPPPRPASLPDPFDAPRPGAAAPAPPQRAAAPAFFDDPFTLDPAPRPASASTPHALGSGFDAASTPVVRPIFGTDFGPAERSAEHAPYPSPPAPSMPPPAADDPFAAGFGSAFDSKPVVEAPAQPAGSFDFGDFGLPADLGQPKAPPPPPPPPVSKPAPLVLDKRAPKTAFGTGEHIAPAAPAASEPPPVPVAKAPRAPAPQDPAAAEAFLRGLGIAPPDGFTGSAQEMEALGRRYRAMAEALLHLVRQRAQEKGNARVASTVIGAVNVNPFKFLPTVDEVVASLVTPKGPGYLEPDAAITGTLTDLMDHNRRNWQGMQSALRRMVDRFDPALFEAEVEAEGGGLLKAMVTGSRSARLWTLYGERYREMAKAAEDRFLGETGADFRAAYEGEPRRNDDGTA